MKIKTLTIFLFTLILVLGIGGFVYTNSDLLGIKALGEELFGFIRPDAKQSPRNPLLFDHSYEPINSGTNPTRLSPPGSAPSPQPYLAQGSRSRFLRRSMFRNLIVRYADDYSQPPNRYIIPVVGIHKTSLVSTFGAPRPGGRTHQGIDLFAQRGTEVVSATDGMVIRIGQIRLGGNAITVLGEGLTLYYYAHLDSFAPDLEIGDTVHAGQVLGYVGNSGNAATTPPHLHFSMYKINRGLWWMTYRSGAEDPFLYLVERGRTIPRGIKSDSNLP